MLVTFRTLSRYVLIKEFCIKENLDNIEKIIYDEERNINFIITSLRLINQGIVSINKIYFIFDNGRMQKIRFFLFSSHLDSLVLALNECSMLLGIEETKFYYHMDLIFFKNVQDCIKKLCYVYDKILAPLLYFNNYYEFHHYIKDKDICEKLLKINIFFETTLMKTKEEKNIAQNIKKRTSNILKEDYDMILKCMYDVRSKIIHNGSISKECSNQLKRIVSEYPQSDIFSILFEFMRSYVEPIARKILNEVIVYLYNNSDKNLKDFIEENSPKNFE